MQPDQTEDLPLSLLDEPFVLMRPVLIDSVEYLERRDSIERRGILNSILVRPSPRTPGRYEIIDGLWRFTAAKELGLETIPAIIKHGLSDTDVIALQLQANAIRKDASPLETAKHLRRILDRQPGMTATDLARIAGKHPAYIRDRLGLLNLEADIQLAVDRGEIPAQSAYMLAKIPARWRREQSINARTMTVKAFSALAAGIIKQFSEAVQQGRMEAAFLSEFKPQPYLRNVREFKAALDDPAILAAVLAREDCKTLLDAAKAVMKWGLNIDREGIEQQRKKFENRAHKDIESEDDDDTELGKA